MNGKRYFTEDYSKPQLKGLFFLSNNRYSSAQAVHCSSVINIREIFMMLDVEEYLVSTQGET